MRRSVVVWIIGFISIVLLYTAGPAIWFNRATPPILGLPPLYFWFVLVPLLNPVILGVVYLVDRKDIEGGAGVDENL